MYVLKNGPKPDSFHFIIANKVVKFTAAKKFVFREFGHTLGYIVIHIMYINVMDAIYIIIFEIFFYCPIQIDSLA